MKYSDNFPPVFDFQGNQISGAIKFQVRDQTSSILKIKERFNREQIFTFKRVTLEAVSKIIQSLNNSKAVLVDDVPVRIITDNIDLFASKLKIDFNRSRTTFFPRNLKLADIIPIYKKGNRSDQSNYR